MFDVEFFNPLKGYHCQMGAMRTSEKKILIILILLLHSYSFYAYEFMTIKTKKRKKIIN